MNKKILMVTMSMDIGGAETHILELSKGLKSRGYSVIVASNGGKYVEQLEDFGIRHIKLPLHDKKISHVIKSYNGLKKIIKEEKIEIVHVHARIPGYICGKLRKHLNFKFVTTVHGKYKTGFLLNILTNWGEKALAVSDDIKEYLIDNYKVKPHNIRMTVNGINTEIFSENVVASKIENIGRFKNSFNVLHVSRLEDTTVGACVALINSADKLLNKIENLKIIIVGDGSSFNGIKELADEKNQQIGREIICLEGAQTIVNEYISICQVFVGISRAALEAMAMKKPVVLAGSYGYLGIFKEEKLENAIKTNFTCRGMEELDENVLVKDILQINSMNESELNTIGDFSKSVVVNNYSVDRMVDDAIAIYNSSNAIQYNSQDFDISKIDFTSKLKVLVFGYIGFNNSGDDALFHIFSTDFLEKYPNAEITVLANSDKNIGNNNRIKFLQCFNIMNIISGIKNSDIVIANGGSLLQDDTSSRSLYYYLNIINTAKFFKKKVIMISNGLGPIKKDFNKKMVSKIVNKVDLITFRDSESVALSEKLRINNPDIYETIDLVFGYEKTVKKDSIEKIFSNENIPMDKKIVGLVVRPWKDSGDMFSKIAKLCDILIEKEQVNILFIPLQQSKRINDYEASNSIIQLMNNKAYVLKNRYNFEEINGVIAHTELMISMRLHSVIYSLVQGIPVYGLAYQSKVKNYLEEMGLPFEDDLNDLEVDKMCEKAIGLIRNKNEISNKIKESVNVYRTKAKENLNIIYNYIDKWNL